MQMPNREEIIRTQTKTLLDAYKFLTNDCPVSVSDFLLLRQEAVRELPFLMSDMSKPQSESTIPARKSQPRQTILPPDPAAKQEQQSQTDAPGPVVHTTDGFSILQNLEDPWN